MIHLSGYPLLVPVIWVEEGILSSTGSIVSFPGWIDEYLAALSISMQTATRMYLQKIRAVQTSFPWVIRVDNHTLCHVRSYLPLPRSISSKICHYGHWSSLDTEKNPTIPSITLTPFPSILPSSPPWSCRAIFVSKVHTQTPSCRFLAKPSNHRQRV